MILFDTAITQAKDALTALAQVKIVIGAAYMDLDQDTEWSGQSLEGRLEAQRLMNHLMNAYYAIEREEELIRQ